MSNICVASLVAQMSSWKPFHHFALHVGSFLNMRLYMATNRITSFYGIGTFHGKKAVWDTEGIHFYPWGALCLDMNTGEGVLAFLDRTL